MENDKYKNWLYTNNEEKRKLNLDVYLKYFNEGMTAFHKCLDPNKEDNPYGISKKEKDLFYKGYPWFHGYRDASQKYFNKKYKIEEMKEKIRKIVKEYNLILKYSDEYGDPYVETPEGFYSKIA